MTTIIWRKKLAKEILKIIFCSLRNAWNALAVESRLSDVRGGFPVLLPRSNFGLPRRSPLQDLQGQEPHPMRYSGAFLDLVLKKKTNF